MGKKSDELSATERPAAYDPRDTTAPDLTSGLIAPPVVSGTAPLGTPYSEGDPELYSNEFASGMPAVDPELDESTEPSDELEQSRAQIEETRSQMSTTIDAIQEKLSPHNLAQQAKDTVREATVGKAQEMATNVGDTATEFVSSAGTSAKGFGSTLIETVKSNPVPAALAGLGLGWLFMSGRQNSGVNRDYSGTNSANWQGYSPGTGGKYSGAGYSYSGQAGHSSVGDRLSSAQDKVGDLTGQAQDKAANVAGQVQDTAGQVAGQVQDTAGQFADTAQQGAQRAQGAFQQALHSNPLAVGAAAIAVGAAIGLSIPETERENQLLGETRDGVVQQAQQVVGEKAQQVQTVAQQAVGAAKDAAQQSADDQGLTK